MTSQPNPNDLNELLQTMRDIQDLRDAELRRLAQNPDLYAVAQALTDHLDKAFLALCYYDHVVDDRGRSISILTVIKNLQDSLRASFRQLTGREYVSDIERSAEHLVRGPQGEDDA